MVTRTFHKKRAIQSNTGDLIYDHNGTTTGQGKAMFSTAFVENGVSLERLDLLSSKARLSLYDYRKLTHRKLKCLLVGRVRSRRRGSFSS